MVMRMRKIFYITMIFIAGLSVSALSEDIRFEASVNKNKVSLGSNIQLDLNFYGTQDVPAPRLPDIKNFKWQYLGPSRRMSVINGNVSSSVTHMYMLTPLKEGTFTIPSISVRYKGKLYTSKPISVEVIQGPLGPFVGGAPQAAPSPGKEKDLKDRIFLIMEVGKRNAYVNEIIPVKIKLYANKLTVRNIEYPEFAHEGFSSGDFEKPLQYQETIGGVLYDVIEFNTNVFAMRKGELVIGPARIKCSLLVKKKRSHSLFGEGFFESDFFDSFFGAGYAKYPLNLKSAAISINVKPLPQEGAPLSFNGAVGNYQFYLEASPKELRVGDPITLRMKITGEGNFKTVKAPYVKAGKDFKVYDPEVKTEKNAKIFEQVIIPKSDTVSQIPKISFAFFNTETGKYKEIIKGPIPIKVTPLPKGEGLRVFEGGHLKKEMPKEENLGRDIIYIKENPGKFRKKGNFLYKNRLFIALQLVPLLSVLTAFLVHRRRKRLAKDSSYARRIAATKKARKSLQKARHFLNSGERDKFFDTVFTALKEYLGDKFSLPQAGITAEVVNELASRNVDRDILDKLKECFDNCDMARYAPLAVTREDMSRTFKLLEEIVDALERRRI